jgi:hypothetical protein
VDVAVVRMELGEFGGVGVDVGEGEVRLVEGADDVEDVEGPAAGFGFEFFERADPSVGLCDLRKRNCCIYFMITLQAWINAHPGVNVLAFERNSGKSFGLGKWEEVCGFCLASHHFDDRPPKICKFCRAPLREAHAISELPETTGRIYNFTRLVPVAVDRGLPFVVSGRAVRD